jgi:hypothetical protein
VKLIPLAPAVEAGGELGRRIKEAVELARDYRGYVWSQWFRQNMLQMWTIFAVLLGSGGVVFHGSHGGLFTLSLPVSRTRLLGVRAATVLLQLLALAVLPSLLLPLCSPAVGESYRVGDALVHAVCMFTAGTVFFSLAFLLSTIFDDLWRPLLVALVAASALALCPLAIPELSRYSIFAVMSGETYFRTGQLPIVGMILSAAASGAMMYTSVLTISRRDF